MAANWPCCAPAPSVPGEASPCSCLSPWRALPAASVALCFCGAHAATHVPDRLAGASAGSAAGGGASRPVGALGQLLRVHAVGAGSVTFLQYDRYLIAFYCCWLTSVSCAGPGPPPKKVGAAGPAQAQVYSGLVGGVPVAGESRQMQPARLDGRDVYLFRLCGSCGALSRPKLRGAAFITGWERLVDALSAIVCRLM